MKTQTTTKTAKTSTKARKSVYEPCLVNGSLRGVAIYVKADGWYGVMLDGETRIDEWEGSQVQLIR